MPLYRIDANEIVVVDQGGIGKELIAEAKHNGRTDSDEILRDELKDSADQRVRASILLDTIAEREALEVSEDDVKSRVSEMAAQIGMAPENVMKYYISKDGSLEGLRNEVMEEKVLDLLLDKAEIEKEEGKDK